MKLRNKKTGEIINNNGINFAEGNYKTYNSLAELNEEWEDYEEPKEDGLDHIITLVEAYSSHDSERYPKEIVEKLKAWKRLKDKGFRFEGWDNTDRSTIHNFSLFVAIEDLESINKDLDLLFGGEE